MRTRSLFPVAASVILAVVASGCFLRALLGFEEVVSLSEQLERYFAAIQADATTANCEQNPFGPGVTCLYTLPDGSRSSTADLISELGFLGVIIDPLVLELPASATGIRGTYEDGDGNGGDLLVYPDLSVVPVDDTRSFVPSPGRQLVVVELPSGAPVEGVEYRFDLEFERFGPPGLPPVEIKAVATGRIEYFGKTFYPPLFPCTEDFDALPAVALPRAGSLQPIAVPAGLPACDDEPYFYFVAESIPLACDLDNDQDVDRADLGLIMAVRNRDADPGDPRDANDDGRIDANDARSCVRSCTRSRCAT